MNWIKDQIERATMANTCGELASAPVRVDALRNFRELVIELGGDPRVLLKGSQLDADIPPDPDAFIPYRMLVHLLERAAVELRCPDFGMRLAKVQGGAKVLGPIEVAMKNSRCVGDAFRFCADHVRAYSPATRIYFKENPTTQHSFLCFEILMSGLPYQRQVTEQALLLTHHAALDISDGNARAREVWFSHEALAPLSTYRANFGCPVRFGRPCNGIFFTEQDLRHPIATRNPELYALAASSIESRFPAVSLAMSTQVRALISRLLHDEECTYTRVAALVGLHPRTLQRRLRREAQSFETIRDEVRRDLALRWLGESKVSLMRVAQRLGYSEGSVLCRSCDRWFSATPRQLRQELTC